MEIVIKQPGQRLDKFLSNSLVNISRNQIQKLIKQGQITVNSKQLSSHYNLKKNDLIEISELKLNAPDFKLTSLETNFPLVGIIAETDEYLIINKPAGLITHGTEHIKEKTLADWLTERYPAIKKIGDDPLRPGIVHRLDREVNGLMVIAKTQEFFDNLKKQFKDRTIIKEYTALVHGQVKADSGQIDFPIGRSNISGKMVARPLATEGKTDLRSKPALTQFEVIKKYVNFTLLKIKIKTGRTHQIRVHLFAYGYPIVGDKLYSTAKTRLKNKKINLGRIFLVANKLNFKDMANKKLIFEISLPEYLKFFLEKLK